MLATQVPLIEVRAAQALLRQTLQPALGEPDSRRKVRQALAPRTTVEGGIGVLEISGVLAYRPDLGEMFFDGFEDSAEVLSAFRRLEADPDVNALILDINSPGGFSVGGAEIADAVFKSAKPTVAWVGGMMCSLAYWIGSQASAVISTRSAMVGSIGAYVSVVDFHRMLANAGIEVKVFTNKEGTFKAAGMPGVPIAEDHAAEFTRQAQRSFDVFRADVLRAREGVPVEAMQGQVFDGHAAKRVGLVDALGDLNYARAVARRLAR
ncbi:MAG TPA: S49 family peptidase [Verrucomicrobiota bacterium]|nr:S49 family peptidase [Verrucomicrobiota bacterium]HNU50160.1 S49 family peptidase [Verrucomicrobiota bacterium]